jgi:hypothetical protein
MNIRIVNPEKRHEAIDTARRVDTAARIFAIARDPSPAPPGPRADDGLKYRRGCDIGRAGVLQQESAGTGPQPGEHVFVQVERGQYEHPGGEKQWDGAAQSAGQAVWQ